MLTQSGNTKLVWIAALVIGPEDSLEWEQQDPDLKIFYFASYVQAPLHVSPLTGH